MACCKDHPYQSYSTSNLSVQNERCQLMSDSGTSMTDTSDHPSLEMLEKVGHQLLRLRAMLEDLDGKLAPYLARKEPAAVEASTTKAVPSMETALMQEIDSIQRQIEHCSDYVYGMQNRVR